MTILNSLINIPKNKSIQCHKLSYILILFYMCKLESPTYVARVLQCCCFTCKNTNIQEGRYTAYKLVLLYYLALRVCGIQYNFRAWHVFLLYECTLFQCAELFRRLYIYWVYRFILTVFYMERKIYLNNKMNEYINQCIQPIVS